MYDTDLQYRNVDFQTTYCTGTSKHGDTVVFVETTVLPHGQTVPIG
jgi:hypothetical protein